MSFQNYVKSLAMVALSLLVAACSNMSERTLPKRDMLAPQVTDLSMQSRFRRAVILMREGRYDEAEPVLRYLIENLPNSAAPYGNLGILYARTGRWPQAQAMLEKAVSLDPDKPATWTELGVVYRQQGQLEAAQNAYLRALQINPDYPVAHLDVRILYDLYLQNPQQALEHYRRYQQLVRGEDQQVATWITELERRTNPAFGTRP